MQLQVTFPQSSKGSTRGTVHQGKGCARVSHMPGCLCVQKQELSQRGSSPSFPWGHGIACLAPQPHTRQTGCPARTQQCLPSLGSHSTVDGLDHGFLPAFLLCCFFSFFLHLLPKLRVLLVPLAPSFTAAAQFLLKLRESLPSTLAWMHNLASVTYSFWME